MAHVWQFLQWYGVKRDTSPLIRSSVSSVTDRSYFRDQAIFRRISV